MPFLPEPPLEGRLAPRTGVLLVNLGTPEAPTPRAVRRYLKEFLSDPRVVELPRPLWWVILNGIILNLRPRQSAKKYQSIWTPDGSPLKAHTERQSELLARQLRTTCVNPPEVSWAMRYGSPSVADVLARLKAAGCNLILLLPLYPQYAASTTASVFDAASLYLTKVRDLPAIRLVRDFHDNPGYISALAASVREHWAAQGRGDKLVMSFHGLPRYTLERGDPYSYQCQATARRLAAELGLSDDKWKLSFQSRFGRTEWLRPYTVELLSELGRQGTQQVDILCPGFVSDCLETLEEIGIEGAQTFVHAGGRSLRLIPCLNERHDWIAALAALVRSHLPDRVEPVSGDSGECRP